jgi:acetylornithine aminotransferase
MLGIALDREADPVRQQLFREHRMLTGNASEKDTIRLLPALNIHSEALQDFTWALEKSLQ